MASKAAEETKRKFGFSPITTSRNLKVLMDPADISVRSVEVIRIHEKTVDSLT